MLHRLVILLDGGHANIEGLKALQQCFDNNEKLVSHQIVQGYQYGPTSFNMPCEIYIFDNGR